MRSAAFALLLLSVAATLGLAQTTSTAAATTAAPTEAPVCATCEKYERCTFSTDNVWFCEADKQIIAGIIIAVVGGVLLIIICFACCCCREKKGQGQHAMKAKPVTIDNHAAGANAPVGV